MTATKVCSKCGEEKPLDAFHRRADSADGKAGRCRDCRNALQSERRAGQSRRRTPRREIVPVAAPVEWVDDGTPDGWMKAARCRGIDPELFFPSRGDTDGVAAAREVCSTCPVSAPCAEYAIVNAQHYGVWGGLSGKQRSQVRRGRVAS